MRYPPDQKAKAWAAQAGARAFRKCGFNGIGVDGLAAAAGVTSGAFYSNFANKEELLAACLDGGSEALYPQIASALSFPSVVSGLCLKPSS
jgi:AcrR family transcriptional regulator